MNGATCVDEDYGWYTCQCATYWEGTNCEIQKAGVICGTNHYSLTGSITSSNYPSNYNVRETCFYLIRAHGATTIELQFISFQTEDLKDILSIGIGPTQSDGSTVTQLMGSPSVLTYTYNTDQLWLQFSSDPTIALSGWSFTYSADGNDCFNSPCANGGTCIDGLRSYTCVCAPGYTGNDCETDLNECHCLNGGVCNNLISGITCTCAPGYIGTICEINVDECASSPCQNGAFCKDLARQLFLHMCSRLEWCFLSSC
ncbi:fibropellin-3-like [Antedon mediterranea]|uniref:fibropellin-3-like n=1 Tax=Antedon mediterranea TaxID=105859 RepID=UPI003AF7B5F9